MANQGGQAFEMLASLCGVQSTTKDNLSEVVMGYGVLGSPPTGLVDEKERIAFEKKQQKRAANRRSAQLSRKRKKVFIEELKDENNDLKKRVHILRHIPDLVIVFNLNPPTIDFMSDAASEILNKQASEMEGKNIWDYMDSKSKELLTGEISKTVTAFNRGASVSENLPDSTDPMKKRNAIGGTMKQELANQEVMSDSAAVGGAGGNSDAEAEAEAEVDESDQALQSLPLPGSYKIILVTPDNLKISVTAQGVCTFSAKECAQCVLSIRGSRPFDTDDASSGFASYDSSSTNSSAPVHCISDVDSSSIKNRTNFSYTNTNP